MEKEKGTLKGNDPAPKEGAIRIPKHTGIMLMTPKKKYSSITKEYHFFIDGV